MTAEHNLHTAAAPIQFVEGGARITLERGEGRLLIDWSTLNLIFRMLPLSKERLVLNEGRWGGLVSHMKRVMDAAGVPNVEPIHRRVELACLLLEQARVEARLARLEKQVEN